MAAAEEVGDHGGEERSDGAVREAEEDRGHVEAGQRARRGEAEEGRHVQNQAEGKGRSPPHAIGERAEADAACDGGHTECAYQRGREHSLDAEAPRQAHQVHQRIEDGNPRRREEGEEHPEGAAAQGLRDRVVASGRDAGRDGGA